MKKVLKIKISFSSHIYKDTPLTWEWTVRIRSTLWFSPIIFLAKLLKFFNFYSKVNLLTIMRFSMAVLSTISETSLAKVLQQNYSLQNLGNYFLLLSTFSRFNILAATKRKSSKILSFVINSF